MMDGPTASDELKKVDHLVFVTLKYTRTVDVIRSAIERMILTLNTQFAETLERLHGEGKIDAVPAAPIMKTQLLEKTYPRDKELKNITDFYFRLKKLYGAEYKKKEEFRKNVALVTPDGEVSIDTLKDYVDRMKKYINYLSGLS